MKTKEKIENPVFVDADGLEWEWVTAKVNKEHARRLKETRRLKEKKRLKRLQDADNQK